MIADLSSLDQPIGLDTASPTGELKSLSKEELLALVTKQNAAIAAHEEQKAVRTKQIALGEQEKLGFGDMMTSRTPLIRSPRSVAHPCQLHSDPG